MAGAAANLAGMAFIPYYHQIMKILETDKRLRHTILGIAKQMGYAAAGAACGGVVAGPVGAMVGGIAGSVYGYMHAENYDSMLEVLRTMSDEEKKHLVEKVQELVGSTGIEALTGFIGTQINRDIFGKLVHDFIRDRAKGA